MRGRSLHWWRGWGYKNELGEGEPGQWPRSCELHTGILQCRQARVWHGLDELSQGLNMNTAVSTPRCLKHSAICQCWKHSRGKNIIVKVKKPYASTISECNEASALSPLWHVLQWPTCSLLMRRDHVDSSEWLHSFHCTFDQTTSLKSLK